MPSQQMAAIEDGETLLTAAERAGVYVNSICGGEGLCGKCRLILQRGQVDSQPTALLTRDEIRQGYVLACQTRVHSDVVVEVPPESQLEGRPQLVKEEAIRFGGVAPRREGAKVYEFDPLCEKQLLEMSPLTLHDNLADRERVFRVIRQTKDIILWQRWCPTHITLYAADVLKWCEDYRKACIMAHPECSAEVLELAGEVASTSGMLAYAGHSQADQFIVGTEMGLIHRLQNQNPGCQFYSPTEYLICPTMKMTTLERVHLALETMEYVVTVPEDV